MIKKEKYKIAQTKLNPSFFFCFSFFFFSIIGIAQNIYDIEHSLKYASFLEKNKKYLLAAEEYERINFMNPDVDSLKLKLIQLYVKDDCWGIIETKFNQYAFDKSKMPASFAKEYVRMLLKTKRFDEAFCFISGNKKITESDKNQLLLLCYMLQNNFTEASKILQTADIQKTVNLPEYKNLISDGLNAHYKSPAVALGLSAILPGLGKVYTKNYYDGIISFAFVGLSAFEAYCGFEKRGKHSIYGWISSGIAVGFYTGSLYGSYKAAKIFNKKIKSRFYKNA